MKGMKYFPLLSKMSCKEVYFSLLNWYDEKNWSSTMYGTAEQLGMHFIFGKLMSVPKKTSYSAKRFNIFFPFFEESITLTDSELRRHPRVCFDVDKLPHGCCILKEKGDIDPLVCNCESLPHLPPVDSLTDQHLPELKNFVQVALARDAAMKLQYCSMKDELLEIDAYGIFILEEETVSENVPEILKCSALSRADLPNGTECLETLESSRKEVLKHIRVQTSIFAPLQQLEAFQYFFINKCHKVLGFQRKRARSAETWSGSFSLSFIEAIIIPTFVLSGFKKTLDSELGSGQLHQLSGDMNGLKKCGIDVNEKCNFNSPFARCEYYTEKEALFGSHYSEPLPFVINPTTVLPEHICIASKSLIVNELGNTYDLTQPPARLLYDIMTGRLESSDSIRHNYGIKWWAMMEPNQVAFDVLEMKEGLDICIIEVRFYVRRERLTVHRDIETGRVKGVVADA